MTESTLLLLLYGLSAWGAALNCPAWARLLWKRWREPRGRWWTDTRMLIRTGLTSLSLGIAMLAGTRLWGALFDAVPITVPSHIGVAAIAFMAAAEPFFLRVDELNAREHGGRSIAWRVYWAGVAAALVMLTGAAIRG